MSTLYAQYRENREVTLHQAEREGLSWDVFVSHKFNYKHVAVRVAECIKSLGLVAWVDVLDPTIHKGDPDLDARIERILTRSFSLMAVVSDTTKESWWVPFEIGIAYELRRYLSVYTEKFTEVELPLFLEKRPKVTSLSELHSWCDKIKTLKGVPRDRRIFSSTGIGLSAHEPQRYVEEMQNMAMTFRG